MKNSRIKIFKKNYTHHCFDDDNICDNINTDICGKQQTKYICDNT